MEATKHSVAVVVVAVVEAGLCEYDGRLVTGSLKGDTLAIGAMAAWHDAQCCSWGRVLGEATKHRVGVVVVVFALMLLFKLGAGSLVRAGVRKAQHRRQRSCPCARWRSNARCRRLGRVS